MCNALIEKFQTVTVLTKTLKQWNTKGKCVEINVSTHTNEYS